MGEAMKKILTVIVLTLMVAGCGGGKKESSSDVTMTDVKKDYISEGMQYLKNKDLDRAIRSFDLAIKQDPRNANNYLFLGQIYLRLKQNDQAADTFDAATKVDPNNGQAHFFLAVSRALQQRKEEAILAAQRSADLFMQARNEEMFKQSIALVKGLKEKTASNASQNVNTSASDVSVDIPASINMGSKKE